MNATPIAATSEYPSGRSDAAVLRNLAGRYPQEMVAGQLQDVQRILHNLRLALAAAPDVPRSQLAICDLGGGIGLFSVGAAALGVGRSVLVDDFDDQVNHRTGPAVLDLHRSLNVEIHSRDVVTAGIADIHGAFDVITSFDSMEHWHHSPKKLFAQVAGKLKPGGAFVLGVPNCANLRKRIAGLLGRNKWTAMDEWYEAPVFRGHVREPDVEDLHYIARDMGLERVRITGRNWLGHHSSSTAVRGLTRVVDPLLQLWPSLCSDITLVAFRPQSRTAAG
jgi:SAM-dependent methyltransferase